MAERLFIRLTAEKDWPEVSDTDCPDLDSLRTRPDSAWVQLLDGGLCRMGAIAEVRVDEDEEPEKPSDDPGAETIQRLIEKHDEPKPPDYE
jgi:hypothetical protein